MADIPLTLNDLTHNFTITDGQTNRIFVEVFESDDVVLRFLVVDSAGDAVDVSGWTGRAFGIYPPASGTADVSITPSFETDGTDGYVLCTLTDAQMTDIDGERRIEMQVTGAGIKLTPMRGVMTVHKTYVA